MNSTGKLSLGEDQPKQAEQGWAFQPEALEVFMVFYVAEVVFGLSLHLSSTQARMSGERQKQTTDVIPIFLSETMFVSMRISKTILTKSQRKQRKSKRLTFTVEFHLILVYTKITHA